VDKKSADNKGPCSTHLILWICSGFSTSWNADMGIGHWLCVCSDVLSDAFFLKAFFNDQALRLWHWPGQFAFLDYLI